MIAGENVVVADTAHCEPNGSIEILNCYIGVPPNRAVSLEESVVNTDIVVGNIVLVAEGRPI